MSNSQLDALDGVTNDVQNLSLSKDPRSTDVDIKEWIRQTSSVAVSPDALLHAEGRDTNSPTFTDSSVANSLKVGKDRVHVKLC